DFLELLLVDLGLGALARLLVAELAVIEDLAHGGSLVGGDLDEVEVGLACHLHGLGRGHHAELFAVDADQADGADADLLVDPLTTVVLLLRMTVGGGNTSISFQTRERSTLAPAPGGAPAGQGWRQERRVVPGFGLAVASP